MELHVWARLDVNGKIQSVQSMCNQIPDSSPSPSSPFRWPDGDRDLFPDVVEGEKVFPYCEKKDLIKKLDTKVDEMSMMVMQITDLNKRNILQDKLIKQYEETIQTLKQRIGALEIELSAYKAGNSSTDIDAALHTDRGIVRNSQTSFKLVCSVETETKITEQDLPQHGDNIEETNEAGNGLECCCAFDSVHSGQCSMCEKASAERPKTLSIGLEFGSTSSSSNTNSDSSSFTGSSNDIIEINGYSYAQKHSDSNENPEDRGKPNHEKACKTVAPPFDCTDGNGYLCFPTPPNTVDKPDGLPITEGNSYLNVDKLSLKELNGRYQEKDINESSPVSHTDDAIHAYFCPTPKSHKTSNSRYVEIDDNLLVDVMDRPPMPTPRRQRSTDDDEFCFVDAHSKLPRKHSGNGVGFDYNRNRRAVGDGCGDDRHGNERAHTLPVGERIRSQSEPEIRLPDQLNNVLRDMRTTMEWNTEKRELMSISTSCTVAEAQQELDRAVREIHTVFLKVMQKRSKRKSYTAHDIFLKVKDRHKFDVSDEFCEKCVALMLSSKRVRTP